MTAKLSIVHWNDVYRVTPQKISSSPSAGTIDVAQFGALLDNIRKQWPILPDGRRDGLSLFSGDVFSPSVESSVSRGSHMVPIMNALAPNVSLTGNHDFDFGYLHLTKLIKDTTFPWLLSNIIDQTTSRVPEGLYEYQIFERAGVRIGIIGLVEREWVSTVATWPPEFEYQDMKTVALELSQRLRDPESEYRCDLIIALTHSRLPNVFTSQDIVLAKEILALSPEAQKDRPIYGSHGVDLILGGHDHLYYVSRGVTSWNNYEPTQEVLGAEQDNGDVLVIKSGTDFRDFSEINLTLRDTPTGSIRKKVIREIFGTRHETKPGSRSSESITALLKRLLSSISSTLKAPVCRSLSAIDVRSQFIRTDECAAGNWIADIIRHAYDDALCLKGCGGADGVLICAGTLRGDTIYGPGVITLGNILEILPFDDPVVVLELDGPTIWDALEAALRTWPAQEGRFPVISGFRVSWDSRRHPGDRVIGVWLLKETSADKHLDSTTKFLDVPVVEEEPISKEDKDRKYSIVTRYYMACGHDGYTALKDKPFLIDDENGILMSTIVRKYLLGSQFVNKMIKISNTNKALRRNTAAAIDRERARQAMTTQTDGYSRASQNWKHLAMQVLTWKRSSLHYQDQLCVCVSEHMSSVDIYDGTSARKGDEASVIRTGDDENEGCLCTVCPHTDGRLRDEGRA